MELNKFTNQTVQKGFCEGVAGCLEHNELLAAALEDARKNERQIVVCWLDLKNAFGSIRHNLLQTALKGYSVPVNIRKILFNYYNQLIFSIVNKNWKTKVMPFEIGLFQGCCLSPVLFKLVFSLLERKLLSSKAKGYKFKSNKETPPVLTFVDDTTLVSSKVKVVKNLLHQMENFCLWTNCLQMKPAKCYTLALARIKSKFKEYDPCLTVHGEKVQIVQEGAPFKFLGRHLDFKGRDAGVDSWKALFLSFLIKVENLHIMGPKKAWIYQHVLLSHLTWAFLLYDFPVSALQDLERESVKLLKKWFLLSRSTDPSILFRPTQNFGLGISNITVRYKQLRCVKHCLLKKSKDDAVTHLAKDKSTMEIESRAEFYQMFISGANSKGRGLGWSTNDESQSDIMKRIVLEDYVQDREVHALQLKMQNDWVCVGEFCIPPRLAWKSIMYDWSPALLKFYLNAFQYTLPDPSNLKKWGKVSEEENVCQLCKKTPCTARHILTGCKVALEESRYTYRHDKVLRIVREAVSLSIAQSNKYRTSTNLNAIYFIKQGEKAKETQQKTLPSSCLFSAKDWQILMDLNNNHYIFPPELYITSQCPDILAFSVESKQVLLIELTVPWEENMPNQHLEKTRRYEEIVLGLRMRGFRTHFFAVEIGARGLPGKSMHHLLKSLGLSRKHRNTFIERMSKTATEASFIIWLNRGRQWGGCEVSVEAS
uniref:Reverse transcriptase domain-containing protein n=2 Tax=Cuerna arida TaxID=1464854 RepID=A0A1B6G7S5_9HEMI